MDFEELRTLHGIGLAVLIENENLPECEWDNLNFNDYLKVYLEAEKCEESGLASYGHKALERMVKIGVFQDWWKVRKRNFNSLGTLHNLSFEKIKELAKTFDEWKIVYDEADSDHERSKALAELRRLAHN